MPESDNHMRLLPLRFYSLLNKSLTGSFRCQLVFWLRAKSTYGQGDTGYAAVLIYLNALSLTAVTALLLNGGARQ